MADSEVELWCGDCGRGTTFPVMIAQDAKVNALRHAIIQKKSQVNSRFKVDPEELTLYLAGTKDGGKTTWLAEDGKTEALLKCQIDKKYDRMYPSHKLEEYLGANFQPQPGEIHVLVELPQVVAQNVSSTLHDESKKVVKATIKEEYEDKILDELKYYQRRGELIQKNCKENCDEILKKVEDFYKEKPPLPFICVEGSSGMGKSQLAFALQGGRPYFYWLASGMTQNSQKMYKSFASISNAFEKYVLLDDPASTKDETRILNSESSFYHHGEFWTYGFLRALLDYCCRAKLENGRMIHLREVTLNVAKCSRLDVTKVIESMKSQNKSVPFFILDEMSPLSSGIKMCAFQRNVFRACGLVVVIMGTDSKVTNLIPQSIISRDGEEHLWMAISPRFPSYQFVLGSEKEEETWSLVVQRFPVVQYIAQTSRGWFARLFSQRVLRECVKEQEEIQLNDLLDNAFDAIHGTILAKKPNFDAQYAQMVAVSYTNVRDEQPPKKKARLQVGSSGMHGHFANLVDESLTDIFLSADELRKKVSVANPSVSWEVKCCFPAIDQDVLLYLSVLGGKSRSAYFKNGVHYSTRWIFEKTKERDHHGNTEAPSNDYWSFENMVAHAIFCSSRRNGVQGIPFDEFISCLVGEFQDEEWEKMPLKLVVEEKTTREILATDLLQGYSSLAKTLSVGNVIPFLAPPNAEWPESILQANKQGCNFGHLVRPENKERCDVYVQNKGVVPLFFGECKYHNDSVDISKINGIIKGISKNDKWPWDIIFVFCPQLAIFRSEWAAEYPSIGCVKINCKDAKVTWIHNPQDQNRKQLVVVMEVPNAT